MAVLFFILGTIIGSFISVLTHRLEHKTKGIWLGRSECPNCKTQLQARDLIPIFSYIFNQQKCRFCHKKISIIYPLLELTTGLIFVLTYLKFNTQTFHLTGWLLIFSLGIAISKFDLKTKQIPLQLSIPLGIISLIFSYFILQNPITNILLSAFLGFSFFYLQYFISKGKWTGLGDADLGLTIGILTANPFLLLQTLTISYILGATVGIILLVTKKSKLNTQLAFGPFLILGLFLNALYSEQIQNLILPTL